MASSSPGIQAGTPSVPLFRRFSFGKLTLCLALLWFLLALFDFPPPGADDISYAGPGIEVANGHGPINPWGPYYHKFGGRSSYPPFYAYILGGWLKAFGVSASSLLFFMATCGAATATAMGFWVRRWKLPAWAELAAGLIVVVLASTRGLRPDLCGLALFAVGTCLEAGEGRLRKLLGTVLIFSSVVTLPTLGVPSATYFLYRFGAGWLLRPDPAVGIVAAWRGSVFRLAAAGAITGFLFLWGIDFHPALFLQNFRSNAKDALDLFGPTYFQNIFYSVGILIRLALLPMILAVFGIAMTVVSYRAAAERRSRIAILLTSGSAATGFALMFFSVTSSSSGLPFLNLACGLGLIVLAGLAWNRGWKAASTSLAVSVCVTFLICYWGLLGWAVSAPFRLETREPILKQIEAEKPDLIMIDIAAARYLYDYRMPLNVRDATFDDLKYSMWKKLSPEARSQDRRVWVFSTGVLIYQEGFEYDRRIVPLRLFGRKIPHCFRNASELFFFK